MTRTLRAALVCLAVALVAVGLAAGVARAEEEAMGSAPPAACFAEPHRWAYDRAHEDLAEPGQRFFADMKKCAPTFAASIEEAVRYRIQTREAEIFARNKKFVIVAYGVAWALLAFAAAQAYLRQRKLAAHIAELEAKLKASGTAS